MVKILDKEARTLVVQHLKKDGVIFVDEVNTYIDESVKIGAGTLIYPGVCIEGNTVIGENCIVHMGCMIKDTEIGNDCVLKYVWSDGAKIGDGVTVGPFVNLRPNTVIADGCKVGDFVEIKNSNIGARSKVPHLTYVGDADVGRDVNIGCGTVFVNYDGYKKQRSTIGDKVFIGCNTNIVAPVRIDENAYTAAGTTVTVDVESNALAVGRARQVNIRDWAMRHRKRNTPEK